ncbi:hypothetical protein BDB00DRAFT_853407 [Zychaea mexicana]|uniref:uncharacterized protein n=1 Tax=Zychaea mexicana TaxID=64656 RepID=UPI0022FF158F|nr:uncharacterized protein BDB00DRAFT_853407 [Zychaea mexicana]KAI9484814.1 hypothetical protein BDB00DRAFT_853407 [Zychaea mexicana]
MDPNLFLPTRQDQVKAELAELRKRLSRANEEKEKLKREIMEEDIAYIATVKLSSEIKDTTRDKASELLDKQQEILSQLMEAVKARCVQELIGYYRLAGQTLFTFQRYRGIRFETFYGQTYYEPYYLLLLPIMKGQITDRTDFSGFEISKHTIPNFIPVEKISKAFFPRDMNAFIRVLHDFLLAYVGRRAQYEAMQALCGQTNAQTSVTTHEESIKSITIVQKTGVDSFVVVDLIYENLADDFPTKVKLSPEDREHENKTDIFLRNRLPEAYKLAFSA